MLYDAPEIEKIVDSEAAPEFMKEATKLASTSELEDVAARLGHKSEKFRALLAPDRIEALDEAGFAALTGQIFSLRRKAGRLMRANGLETIRAELAALLYGSDAVGVRIDRFTARIVGVERAMVVSLATEALHFVDPERFWLWTYWIWNPQAKTGVLALVTHEAAELPAAVSDGEIYEKVGRAIVLVDRQGHAAGYSGVGRGLFGTDLFLACAYAVYMYTVFRLKLSQEFNRILPELPELVERVLGVRKMGAKHGK
jgi:hypothetical protein